MNIEYELDESDMLTHQLFIASKSERIKKKRKRSKVLVPIIYLFLGILYLPGDTYTTSMVFFLIGLSWYLIYPIWESRHYIKHYKGFLKEHYKNNMGGQCLVELNNDYIFIKDKGSESKVSTIEIEVINEIPTSFFIRLKGLQSLIIPKNKISDIAGVRSKLKEISTYHHILYEVDENWKWK